MKNKVTIKDVAEKACVAISTVSNALNPESKKISEDKRKEILKIIEQMGYFPSANAKNLASKKNKRVGFFINNTDKFDSYNSINMQLIYFMNKYAGEKNVDIINLFSTSGIYHNSDLLYEKILKYGLTDIIIFGLNKEEEALQRIINLSVKKILIDIPITNSTTCFVSIDNYQAQKDLTNFVIQNEKIKNTLYITGSLRSYVAQERLRGFVNTCKRNKINYKIIEADYSGDLIYNKCSEIDFSKYDSVVCGSDSIVLGIIKFFRENNLNKILAGFDGLQVLNHVDFPVYSVLQDFDKVCKTIIEMIVDNRLDTKLVNYEIKKFN